MALVESGMRELGFGRAMESLRQQIRPEDDRVEIAPGVKGSAVERWLYAATLAGENRREAEERCKHNYSGPLVPDQPQIAIGSDHVDDQAHDVDPRERYSREIAALRADVTALKQAVATPGKRKRRPAPAQAPLSRKQKLRDVAHRLTGHHGSRGR